MRKRTFGFFHFLCVFVACGVTVHAQVFFSVNPDYIREKREPFVMVKPFVSIFADTSITTLHHYLPRNYLGNPGLPTPEYLLDFRTDELGFRFFVPPYSNDRFLQNNIPYYRTAGPYASLTGIAGSKEMQIFKAFFSQTYRSRINLSLGFRRYTSLGYYRRQQTFTNNFYATSNYSQRSGRFGYYLFFLNNSNRHNENGGISEGYLNDSTALLQKDLMNVKLTGASRDNRENIVQLNPWTRLFGGPDSLRRFQTILGLRSSYKFASFEYGDRAVAVDTFYRNTFFHNELTTDSSHVSKLSNELAITMDDSYGSGFGFAYRHERNMVWQVTDSVLTNQVVSGNMSWRLLDDSMSSLGVRASAQYVVSGANIGNYLLEGALSWGTKKRKEIAVADFAVESRDPDQLYRFWRSNHFRWHRGDLRPQTSNRARLRLNLTNHLVLGAYAEQVGDFLYFDSLALPEQLSENIFNGRVFLGLSKVFWRHLGVGVNYDYQLSSAPDYVRLPAHHLQARLFFQGFFFRSHLQLNLGTEVELFDKFTPYAYMPATQVFYLQSEVRTSPYPFADIYLNIRIRPVSVFFRLENVLKGFAGPDYFLVPGYYQPDRALRFGINWMFFD